MSFNLYDFVVSIKADDSEATAAMNNTGGQLETLSSKFGGMKAVGVAAFAAVGAAAFKFASDSVEVGMQFDQSISQVAATMGTTVDQMENMTVTSGEFEGSLRDLAIEMGSKTAFSANQAAEALNYMALAGYDAQTSADMLPKVLDLAAAGSMELATASDMITDSQTALGLSIEETSTLVDQMAKTASTSNTSVEQLGDAILRVGGTAKGMKGGTTELNAALGILADNGTKGAAGGTALRNVLLGIKSDKFEKTFGELGVSAYDAQGNLRSLEDVFLDMQDAMDGMTQQERDEIITKTFNKADLKNINALLGTSKERWDDLTASIEDSEGAASDMAETQLDNLAGDVTLFQSALEGLQIAISDGLSPTLRDFVQVAGDGLGNIQAAFTENGLGGGIAAFIDMIGEMGGLLLEKLITLPALIGETLAKNASAIIESGIGLINSLLEGIFTALPNLIQKIPEIITEFVNGLGQGSSGIMEKGMELLTTLANGLITAIPQLIMLAPTLIGTLASAITKNAPRIIESGITLLVKLVSGIVKGIPRLLQKAPELITKFVGAIIKNLPKILTAGITIITSLVKGLGSAAGSAVGKIREIVSSIKDKVIEKAKDFLSAGLEIVRGIWQGISDGKEWIKGKIREWIGNVKDFFKQLFGIKSPSKWARDVIGWNIAKGLALGLEDGQDEVQDAMEDLMPDDYEYETAVISGGIGDALTLSLAASIQDVLSGLVPEMQEAMIQAMEGVQVKVGTRQFGRLTREAVNGTI